jgi:hypothetical protein
MSFQKKWLLMFSPLVLLLVGLLVAIDDLKHPTTHQDRCTVLGTGLSIGHHKTGHNMIYSQGAPAVYDVGFRCNKLGVVVLNDQEPFKRSIAEGNLATIIHKTYRFLPEVWRVSVETGSINPN